MVFIKLVNANFIFLAIHFYYSIIKTVQYAVTDITHKKLPINMNFLGKLCLCHSIYL